MISEKRRRHLFSSYVNYVKYIKNSFKFSVTLKNNEQMTLLLQIFDCVFFRLKGKEFISFGDRGYYI